MTKAIYKTTDDDAGFAVTLVADDYTPAKGETMTAPPEGVMLPAHYDAGTDTWTGATDDEHTAYVAKMAQQNPVLAPTPSTQEAINAQLLKQSAANAAANAIIIKELAALTAQSANKEA